MCHILSLIYPSPSNYQDSYFKTKSIVSALSIFKAKKQQIGKNCSIQIKSAFSEIEWDWGWGWEVGLIIIKKLNMVFFCEDPCIDKCFENQATKANKQKIKSIDKDKDERSCETVVQTT